METSPLLHGDSARSPPPTQGDIYRDAFPASYSDSETEDEATGLPSSPPRYIEPDDRKYQDTTFAFIFLSLFTLLVVTGASTLARADHSNEGASLSGAIYLTLRNSTGLIVGVTAASVGAGTVWILFMSAFVKPIVWGTIIAIPVLSLGLFTFILTDSILGKNQDPPYLGNQYNIMIGVAVSFLITALGSITYLFKRRRQIDQTINILQLSCQILWENPTIFVLSLTLMLTYMIFSLLWLLAFSHLFLVHPTYPIPMSTRTAVGFFVLMHFWTSAVLQGIEKVTIAGVVGKWYFKRNFDETHEEDQTLRNLKAAVSTGFGTVCFSAGVLALAQTAQAFVKFVRKYDCVFYAKNNSRGSSGGLLLLLDACMSCFSYSLDTLTSMTLLYSGLTGHSLLRSGVLCTRLFRRNLVFGLTTSTLTRVVLTLGAITAASCVGAATFFYAARGLTSPFAYVVGVVGVVVPFYVLRFISHVLQYTVDATFICYMIDLDTNANNCDGAHQIFEPSLSLFGIPTIPTIPASSTSSLDTRQQSMMADAAARLLVSLEYDTVLPLGASGLLTRLVGRNARAVLLKSRSAIMLAITASWVARAVYGDWPRFNLVFSPLGGARTESTDTFGLALVFYFALLVLHSIQHSKLQNHMKTLGPIMHLTLWCIHTFTMTTILSTILSVSLASHLNLPPQPSSDYLLCVVGVGMEILLSRWTVHWILFALGLTAIFLLNIIASVSLDYCLVSCTSATPLTMSGIGVVVASFMLLWAMEHLRENVFPSSRRSLGLLPSPFDISEDVDEGLEIVVRLADGEKYEDHFCDDSRLLTEMGYSEGEAKGWNEEVLQGLLEGEKET
ncbi:hypothetical protein HDU67_004057 [Dinochytrium kinnereticum]|nr:hypothetical protein HDU67_004057 [Dinochytrium kinnereticum]